MNSAFDACRAYLAQLPNAISGAGGHASTFRAACECVRFGLGDGDAMTLLREWNRTHCQPAWTEAELTHKLSDARREAGGRVRSFRQPAPAVRVVWKIERKTAVPVPVEAVEANPPTPEPILAESIQVSCATEPELCREPDVAEVLPHFTAGEPSGLLPDQLPWLPVAKRILLGEFEGADRSTRQSLAFGLKSIRHPVCEAALARIKALGE